MKQYLATSLLGASAVALSLPLQAGTDAGDNSDARPAPSIGPVSEADDAENILIRTRFYF